MMLPATIVDTQALLETAAAALAAGVGVALTFSLAILGTARYTEEAREHRHARATAFALLGVMGLLATAAAIVAGIVAVTS